MKHDELFEVLEPPPHGLTRLRAAMEEKRRHRVMWPAVVAASAAAALLLLMPRQPDPLVSAARAELMAPADAVTGHGDTAVEALPSSTPGVVIYRVATW